MFDSIEYTYRFFKRPNRVGDVIDVEGVPSIILGIEQVRFTSYPSRVTVRYTIQDLSTAGTDPGTIGPGWDDLPEFVGKVKAEELYDDAHRAGHPIARYHPGNTFTFNGTGYKVVEYTDIELVETTYLVRFVARPLRPVPEKVARAKLLRERWLRSGLRVLQSQEETDPG